MLSFKARTHISSFIFFFFNDTATTEIYTLSLHDALPILSADSIPRPMRPSAARSFIDYPIEISGGDRKSTRLNSSHVRISYAVFCLKKKKPTKTPCLAKPNHINKSKSIPTTIQVHITQSS